MKDLNEIGDFPFLLKISFNKYLNHYDELAKSDDEFLATKAKKILEMQAKHPFLREGFRDITLLDTYEKEIRFILQDSFSDVLGSNEIKTASIPYHNLTFNSSQRFQNIIKAAGNDYDHIIHDMHDDDKYRVTCTIILSYCYGYNLRIKRQFFYKIPDAEGIPRHYKILYNGDFMEIIPSKKAPKITQEDVDELLDNYENIELWKEKFPRDSYLFQGFVIANIFDVTEDQSISEIKSNLIGSDQKKRKNFAAQLQRVFQSLLNVKELKIGFSVYNTQYQTFEKVYGNAMDSFLLYNSDEENCTDCLCDWSYNRLFKENKSIAFSDITKKYNESEDKTPQIKTFYEQKIESAILAPIANDKELLGVLELVSDQPKKLNSINANKLIDVMPHIVAAVERSKEEEENLIEAIIQTECTSIHSSVHWRFKEEAKRFIKEQLKGNQVSFNKIAFKDVYPLYGQIDIKGSSEARNDSTQKDLTAQLSHALTILKKAHKLEPLPIYEQYLYQINNFLDTIEASFQVDTEQKISAFLNKNIKKLFKYIVNSNKLLPEIKDYFYRLDKKLEMVYQHRKEYDDTITIINKKMASIIDKKQIEAQKMHPHFFERYKTDGIEHNIYIGESITKRKTFDITHLHNIRLWQLQTMCEMENYFYQMQPQFPMKLDVASMVLVFSTPLTISFRMDEKQFDVDGTYNARYEVVKKRVDKAYIKGTTERITEKGKLTIVYSQKEDEREYLKYINFLQSKNYVGKEIEILELEDLQAVTGLKALRVNILYTKSNKDKVAYTYNDLMEVINNN